MPGRWFDHQILVVKDVPAAMRRYARLGFFVSPQMRHSFGSSNALIMFLGNFLELLGDLDKVQGRPDLRPDPGLWKMAFQSIDARRDFDELTAKGLAMSPVMDFTRPVPMPGGREGLIDCSVTSALRPERAGIEAFVSNQRRPEFLWVPEWQHHPNGVDHITAVVCMAERPEEHRDYLERFVDPTMIVGDADGVVLADASGVRIEVLTPEACRRRLGGMQPTLPPNRSSGVVALSLRTRSLTVARSLMDQAEVPTISCSPRSFLVSGVQAEGTFLEFVGVD
jgi:hypothetical protein